MMQDPLTLYKLIVLYMLDRVNFPLTKTQVIDFMQEKEYTSFFTLQQVMSELEDTGLITAQSIRNRTHLSITDEGLETLRFLLCVTRLPYREITINPPAANMRLTYWQKKKVSP